MLVSRLRSFRTNCSSSRHSRIRSDVPCRPLSPPRVSARLGPAGAASVAIRSGPGGALVAMRGRSVLVWNLKTTRRTCRERAGVAKSARSTSFHPVGGLRGAPKVNRKPSDGGTMSAGNPLHSRCVARVLSKDPRVLSLKKGFWQRTPDATPPKLIRVSERTRATLTASIPCCRSLACAAGSDSRGSTDGFGKLILQTRAGLGKPALLTFSWDDL